MTCNNYANVVHARWFACVWSDVSWCCVLAGARMLTRAAGAMRVGVAVRTTWGGKAYRAVVRGVQQDLGLRQPVWTSRRSRPPPGPDLPCRHLLRIAEPNYFLRFGLRRRIVFAFFSFSVSSNLILEPLRILSTDHRTRQSEHGVIYR